MRTWSLLVRFLITFILAGSVAQAAIDPYDRHLDPPVIKRQNFTNVDLCTYHTYALLKEAGWSVASYKKTASSKPQVTIMTFTLSTTKVPRAKWHFVLIHYDKIAIHCEQRFLVQ